MSTPRQPRQPDGPLRLYLPSHGRIVQDSGPVIRKQIVLLSNQQVIAENMAVQQLIDYIAQITDLTKRIFAASHARCELLMEITFSAGASPALALFSDGATPEELMYQLYDQAATLPPTRTHEASVHIQLVFAIEPHAP